MSSEKETMKTPMKSESSASPTVNPNQGIKRQLQFSSPGSFGTPTAKIQLHGYVLYVSNILKGDNFQVQFQTQGGVQHFRAYESKYHRDFYNLFDKGLKSAVDLKKSRGDGTLYFDNGCLVREASVSEVSFEIGENLKSTFIQDSKSKETEIKELMNIDPRRNKTLFTINALITIGDGDYETISTSSTSGQGEVKNDILAEDKTGSIHLQLFKDQVAEFESGCCYRLTHMKLKKYNFRYYMHTLSESQISKIPDLKIKSVADTVLQKSKADITIEEFTQVRNIDVFKPCPSCNGKFQLVKEDQRSVWCQCGSSIKQSRFKKVKSIFQAEVEFEMKEEFMWATLFSSAMKIEEANLTTGDDVQRFLSDETNMKITVDMQKKLITSVVKV